MYMNWNIHQKTYHRIIKLCTAIIKKREKRTPAEIVTTHFSIFLGMTIYIHIETFKCIINRCLYLYFYGYSPVWPKIGHPNN